jgi:hypothetical protein
VRGLYVPLSLDEKMAFIDRAEQLYRDPRSEARRLLVEALHHDGALPKEEVTLTDAAVNGPGDGRPTADRGWPT